MVSTVKARFVHVELEMKHQFTSSYAARAIGLYVRLYLAKYQILYKMMCQCFPINALSHILIYGSNFYNLVCNRFILTETVTYICRTRRFTKSEAFGVTLLTCADQLDNYLVR